MRGQLLHDAGVFGGDVGDALMIGDSVADVLAAHAAGITCWAVLGGTGTEKSLRDAGPARILTGGMGDVPDLLRAPPAVRP